MISSLISTWTSRFEIPLLLKQLDGFQRHFDLDERNAEPAPPARASHPLGAGRLHGDTSLGLGAISGRGQPVKLDVQELKTALDPGRHHGLTHPGHFERLIGQDHPGIIPTLAVTRTLSSPMNEAGHRFPTLPQGIRPLRNPCPPLLEAGEASFNDIAGAVMAQAREPRAVCRPREAPEQRAALEVGGLGSTARVRNG